MSRIPSWSLAFLAMTGCSLSPEFKLPETNAPASYKEQPAQAEAPTVQAKWQEAKPLDKETRGEWWKIFGDEQLNDLELQAGAANQSLKIAAARVEQARATAGTQAPSFLPDFSIGANAARAQPASASLAAFGAAPGASLKPYTLYDAGGVLSYEVDFFGRVRDNYRAFEADADAQAAAYRSALLSLQADVAQSYFTIRALDAERQLLRDTVKVREEASRIMKKQFDLGETGEQDFSRTESELASVQADLLSLDLRRATAEHALAVLLGKMPSEFMLAEAPLMGEPPEIPAGLPSVLLERRPDIASAIATMQAANRRIGVARTAFFPSLTLTATGGFESTGLGELFQWSSRTWALGQFADALTMPIFDSGRNLSRLDVAHAQYDEAVANYRQQVLVAFRDVEDSLAAQRLLAGQSLKSDEAAVASARTTALTNTRYQQGDVNFFEVVDAERTSLAASRTASQVRGARFSATVELIRALGGGFE